MGTYLYTLKATLKTSRMYLTLTPMLPLSNAIFIEYKNIPNIPTFVKVTLKLYLKVINSLKYLI